MRVGINGFGRIGRSVFRVLNNRDDIDVVAINDIFDKDALTYLLKYDTVMGRFPGDISLDSDILSAGNQKVKLIAERVPEELPWGELGVDIVIESTGIFILRSLFATSYAPLLRIKSTDCLFSNNNCIERSPNCIAEAPVIAITMLFIYF